MEDRKVPFLFTPVQTARILGISRSQVYNLLSSGALNSVQIGRSRRIAQSHVHDFINSLEVVA
jgi:excisionase family DNA binding protein